MGPLADLPTVRRDVRLPGKSGPTFDGSAMSAGDPRADQMRASVCANNVNLRTVGG